MTLKITNKAYKDEKYTAKHIVNQFLFYKTNTCRQIMHIDRANASSDYLEIFIGHSYQEYCKSLKMLLNTQTELNYRKIIEKYIDRETLTEKEAKIVFNAMRDKDLKVKSDKILDTLYLGSNFTIGYLTSCSESEYQEIINEVNIRRKFK